MNDNTLTLPKFEPYAALYEKGRAVGESNIRTETMTFRFRDEVFKFSTNELHGISKWNGFFYEAKVDDLRRLVKSLKEQEDGRVKS